MDIPVGDLGDVDWDHHYYHCWDAVGRGTAYETPIHLRNQNLWTVFSFVVAALSFVVDVAQIHLKIPQWMAWCLCKQEMVCVERSPIGFCLQWTEKTSSAENSNCLTMEVSRYPKYHHVKVEHLANGCPLQQTYVKSLVQVSLRYPEEYQVVHENCLGTASFPSCFSGDGRGEGSEPGSPGSRHSIQGLHTSLHQTL